MSHLRLTWAVACSVVVAAMSLGFPLGQAWASGWSLDPSFGVNGKVASPVLSGDHFSVDLQPDGKTVVGGFTNQNGMDIELARHNVDGSLDTGFGTNGVVSYDLGTPTSADAGVAIQPDGKIVFAGEADVFCSCGGYGHQLLVGRLDANGAADQTFATGGFAIISVPNMVDVNAHNITLQSDGKILVTGATNHGDGVDTSWFLARFSTDGTLDQTFGTQGFVVAHPAGGSTYDDPFNITTQSDDKIIVVGHANNHPIMARFNTDGSSDAAFGVNGIVDEYGSIGQEVITDVAVQSDDKIVVSAGETGSGMRALRYQPDGTRDPSFGNNGIFADTFGSGDVTARSVIIRPDGKIVLGGYISTGGNRDFALARLDTNGNLDNSFGVNGVITTDLGFTNELLGKLMQDADHIVAGGITIDTGNPYALVRYTETESTRQLTALNPAKVWIGLKNSDDVGVKFDLLAEVYKNGVLVTSGQLASVAAGSSGFANAKLDTIQFDSFLPIDFPTGSQLQIKLSVRNACSGSAHNSGVARLWFNDSAANSQFGATIDAQHDYYLLNSFALGTTAGPGPKKTIDVQAGSKCSVFKPFGVWTVAP